MGKTVLLRRFEERDIDFIYKCKKDEKLNGMVVGNWKPLSYEEAAQWVHNCMKWDRSDLKFWAVATNNDLQQIIGWIGLSQINQENRSVCHHGIFIGDKDYQDGMAMFESMLLSMEYVFNMMKMHRLYGSCLAFHKTSPHMLKALGFSLEGVRKDAVIKNENYCDILDFALLEDDYRENVSCGNYQSESLTRNFIRSLKNNKYE